MISALRAAHTLCRIQAIVYTCPPRPSRIRGSPKRRKTEPALPEEMPAMPAGKGMPRRFREMLQSGETYVQPGVFNAQSALITEAAGFKTICVSGYGLSAT